jgi:hypothetical protein
VLFCFSLDEDGCPEPRILQVITGVPRGDDVCPDPEPQHRPNPLPDHIRREREDPATAEPPPPSPPPPPPSPPRVVRVQIEPPSEREPGGVLFEASYTVQDTGPGTGALTVSDFQGRLIGKTDVRTADDADAAARRVVLREKGSPFWRRLQ